MWRERIPLRNGRGVQKERKIPGTSLTIEGLKRQRDEAVRHENRVKNSINERIQEGITAGTLLAQSYFMVKVNYFFKYQITNVHVPAEIALCEYRLPDGVIREYHTHVNPVELSTLGYLFQAQKHAAETHMLPLPPNALGCCDLTEVYNDVLAFVQPIGDKVELPMLFTNGEEIAIVESALKLMSGNQSSGGGCPFDVYSIQYLAFIMKESICKILNRNAPTLHFVQNLFIRDAHDYMAGIACDYHEKLDRTKFCSKSLLKRWALNMDRLFGDDMDNLQDILRCVHLFTLRGKQPYCLASNGSIAIAASTNSTTIMTPQDNNAGDCLCSHMKGKGIVGKEDEDEDEEHLHQPPKYIRRAFPRRGRGLMFSIYDRLAAPRNTTCHRDYQCSTPSAEEEEEEEEEESQPLSSSPDDDFLTIARFSRHCPPSNRARASMFSIFH